MLGCHGLIGDDLAILGRNCLDCWVMGSVDGRCMRLGNLQKEKGFLVSPGGTIQELTLILKPENRGTEKEYSKANRLLKAGLVIGQLQASGT